MSAFVDRAQPISFYYGNAARDLAHLLPPDEAPEVRRAAPALKATGHDNMGHDNMEAVMASLETHLNQLQSHRRNLEFLLKDLKRLLPE